MQKVVFTCFILMLVTTAFCQKQFIEGEIVYNVTITAADAKDNKVNAGTLTISIKANSVTKELNLQSGFRNTIIFNQSEKVAYSLREHEGIQYAIQLDPDQLKKKQEKCTQPERQELESDRKTTLGFATEKVKLTCNNTNPVVVYYTKAWRIGNPNIFQDFPFFDYLPLAYEIKNEDGNLFGFELQKIEAKPIDNRVFNVPPGYKKISQQEYKSGRR
jgi:hypothetical protein